MAKSPSHVFGEIIGQVLRHRLFTNFNADSQGLSPDDIVKKLLETVKEPDEKDYR